MLMTGNFNVFKVFTKINEFCKKPYESTNDNCFFQKVDNAVNVGEILNENTNEFNNKVNHLLNTIPTNATDMLKDTIKTGVQSHPLFKMASWVLNSQKKSDDTPSFFSKLCDFLINTTYNFLFVIAFTLLFLQQILMYHEKFKHQTLKNTFIVICVIFIMIIFSITSGSLMYQRFYPFIETADDTVGAGIKLSDVVSRCKD